MPFCCFTHKHIHMLQFGLEKQRPTKKQATVHHLEMLTALLNSSHLKKLLASAGKNGPKAEALIQAMSRFVKEKTYVRAVHFRFMSPFWSVKDVKQCPFWLDASCTRNRNWTVHIPERTDVVYHTRFPELVYI